VEPSAMMAVSGFPKSSLCSSIFSMSITFWTTCSQFDVDRKFNCGAVPGG
jgi:hypothetical protein